MVSNKKVAKRDLEEDNDIENEEEGWWTAEVIAEWKAIKPGCSNYEAKVLSVFFIFFFFLGKELSATMRTKLWPSWG